MKSRTPSPKNSNTIPPPKQVVGTSNQNVKQHGGCRAAKPGATQSNNTIVKQEENYLARCTNFRLTTGYELSICNCKHIRKIRIGERHSIVNPQRWLCNICLTTESVWACLSCPNVACGRFIKEHALTHFEESGHPMVIDVNELYVFCYKCDDYVLNDNNSSDIKVLRETLLAIRYQNFTGTTRSGHTLRSAMISDEVDVEMRRQMQQMQLDRDDRLFTAIWHSRFVRQRKCFRRWMRYIIWKRKNSSFLIESSDDEEEEDVDSLHSDVDTIHHEISTTDTDSLTVQPPSEMSISDLDNDLMVLPPSPGLDFDIDSIYLISEKANSKNEDDDDDDHDDDVIEIVMTSETLDNAIGKKSIENVFSEDFENDSVNTSRDSNKIQEVFEPVQIESAILPMEINAGLFSATDTEIINDVAMKEDVAQSDNLVNSEDISETVNLTSSEEFIPGPLNILSRPKRLNAAARYKEIFNTLKGSVNKRSEVTTPVLEQVEDGDSPVHRRITLRSSSNSRRSDRIKKIIKEKAKASTKKKTAQKKLKQGIKVPPKRPPPKSGAALKIRSKTIKKIVRPAGKRKPKVIQEKSHRARRLISPSGLPREKRRLNSYRPPSLYDNIPNKTVTSLIPGVTGLRNLGNTCYLNSIIQVLGHLQKFRLCLLALREVEFLDAFEAMSKSTGSKDSFVFSPPQGRPSRTAARRSTVELYNEQTKPTPITSSHSERLKLGLNGGQSLNSTVELPEPALSPSRRNHQSPTHAEENWSSSLSLCNELDHLYQVMWSGKWKLVSPYHFLHSVWSLIPSFRGYTQQDAQEFLCELLDKIVSELERSRNSKKENKLAHRILEVVQKVFEGQLMSEVRCLECCHVSSTVEPFWDLSLEFPERYHKITSIKRRASAGGAKTVTVPSDPCTLHEMLQNFTAPETLEGGRVYGCSKCNVMQQPKTIPTTAIDFEQKKRQVRRNSQTLTEAEKQLKVLELPQVLRFHLKRFRWIGRNHREKIAVHVEFPSELDMRPYCWNNDKESSGDIQYMYDLSAVVIHHGRGFASGHYTANCWNDIGEFWVHCNDSNLELRSIEDVMTSQAYILFYTQRGLDPHPHILSPPHTPKVVSPVHVTQPVFEIPSDTDRDSKMTENVTKDVGEEEPPGS